jgi:hypothetical protein
MMLRSASEKAGAPIPITSHLWLSQASPEPADQGALARWGERLGVSVRRARWLGARLEEVTADFTAAPLRRFLAGDRTRTALDVEPTPWLRLTETQITRSLADFINEDGATRALAFLRALPCSGVDLPPEFQTGRARAEAPSAAGRVDLLITGMAGDRKYGAAVEVKIDHVLQNPLGSYASLAVDEGLVISGPPGKPTGTLVVLARGASAGTLKHLGENKGWRFVHWTAFLRRFEHALAHASDDDDFRAFRRSLWDRLA